MCLCPTLFRIEHDLFIRITCEITRQSTILIVYLSSFTTILSSTFIKDTLTFPTFNALELANLCGSLHQNIKLLEKVFKVTIKPGQDEIAIIGHNDRDIKNSKQMLITLHALAHSPISTQTILSLSNTEEPRTKMTKPIRLTRKTIDPRNTKQAEYLDSINKCDVTFAVGPAGTGKTYLAVAKAIEYFKKVKCNA